MDGTTGTTPGSETATGTSQSSQRAVWLPAVVSFDAVFGLARITQVSCCQFHSLFLTDVGLAYSCGSGFDGALGHGTTDDAHAPRLIEWFCTQSPPVLLKRLACGSDLAGAHSAAVSDRGKLYSWGAGRLGLQHTDSHLAIF